MNDNCGLSIGRIVMNDHEMVFNNAKSNYKNSTPWPKEDIWHAYTHNIINNYVQNILNSLDLSSDQIILNAGCGFTTYDTVGTVLYMDIVDEYVSKFENGIVASIENIPLNDTSINVIICVGSVINYADIQKAISEFSRILVPGGYLILEYERSNSAEFLFHKKYANTVFLKKYHYNDQIHSLFMYDEKFVRSLSVYYGFTLKTKYRFHIISSLLYRIGFSEDKVAKFSSLDKIMQPVSYPFAHNEILVYRKRSCKN